MNHALQAIVPPVLSISVHKHKVVFKDAQGKKESTLANAVETKRFIDRLINS